MTEIKKVIVLGASGDQGIPLIGALIDSGFDITAGVRRADAMQTTSYPKIQTVAADITDQKSLEKAFAGQDALAMHLPFEHNREKAASFGKNIANAAQAVSLKKIVFNTSCYIADHDLGVSAHDGRRDIEKAIRDSGINYVFIEPVVFMNNMIAPWCKPSIVKHNMFAYPASETLKISFISLDDVAALSVAALNTDAADRQSIPVGGPEALTGFEIADKLSAASGKEIWFNSLLPSEFAENISELVTGSREIPEGSVYNGMARFYTFYNEQPISPLAVDPESFLKKLPVKLTSFDDWAQAQDWNT